MSTRSINELPREEGRAPDDGDKSEEDHEHYHGVDQAYQHIGVKQALDLFLKEIKRTDPENISVREAIGRVAFEKVASPVNVPEFPRSTRDGYAVRIDDTRRNRSINSFEIVGEIAIGEHPKVKKDWPRLQISQAVKVATGSYLPEGGNAVIMIEYARVKNQKLEAIKPVKLWENVLRSGEDIAKGQEIIRSGTILRPQHIALLSLVGLRHIKVFRRPKVAFFSTGDELFDPSDFEKNKRKKDSKRKHTDGIKSGKIPDTNRPFITSYLKELGADGLDLGIARDNFEEIRSKFVRGLRSADALILSAGSSVGEKDFAVKAAKSIKDVRLLVHGVSMRPSSPTGLAVYKGKPIVLLPGFPTSAIVSFFVFARPAILTLGGASGVSPFAIRAKLLEDDGGEKEKKKIGKGMLPSRGRVTQFLRVFVSRKEEGKEGNGEYVAKVVRPTDSHYSGWLAKANGIAVLDGEKASGEYVDVFPI
jgi:molybdopterin molybdotransferase